MLYEPVRNKSLPADADVFEFLMLLKLEPHSLPTLGFGVAYSQKKWSGREEKPVSGIARNNKAIQAVSDNFIIAWSAIQISRFWLGLFAYHVCVCVGV